VDDRRLDEFGFYPLAGGPPSPVDAAADLTPAWLTAALRAAGHEVTVTEVSSDRIGHGQMGSNHRLHLTHDAGDAVPATLVAKLGEGEDRSIAAGGYRKEIAFYRDLADTVAIRIPRCWHVSSNEDATVFTLVLEDLAPAEPADQLVGCSAAEATAAVRNLAGLHGPRWCDTTLFDHPELDPVDAAGAAMLSEVFASAVGLFVERYRNETDAWAEALLHRVAEAVGPWILARSDTFALLHGDHRADNLLIDPDGTVTAVDWQTMAVGHPGRDLAYFCETSVEPEIRGSAEDQLVDAYRDGLAEHQVVIGRDEALDIYRFGLFQGPLITVLGAVYATAERSARADAMFLTMLQRSLTAIDDLDPFELI
jgi:hypothetical protein